MRRMNSSSDYEGSIELMPFKNGRWEPYIPGQDRGAPFNRPMPQGPYAASFSEPTPNHYPDREGLFATGACSVILFVMISLVILGAGEASFGGRVVAVALTLAVETGWFFAACALLRKMEAEGYYSHRPSRGWRGWSVGAIYFFLAPWSMRTIDAGDVGAGLLWLAALSIVMLGAAAGLAATAR